MPSIARSNDRPTPVAQAAHGISAAQSAALLVLVLLTALLFATPSVAQDTTAASTTPSPLATYAAAHADGPPLDEAATDGERQRLVDAVETFYAGRTELAWFDGDRPSAAAGELLRQVEGSRAEGLVPEVYLLDELRRGLDGADSMSDDARRELDLLLTRTYLVFASHLASGRVPPSQIDAAWKIEPPRQDLEPFLVRATSGGADTVRSTLEELRPPQREYGELIDALARYREIAAAGGWGPVPDGDVLEVGVTAPATRIEALVARLRATGELDGDYRPSATTPGSPSTATTEDTDAGSDRPGGAEAGVAEPSGAVGEMIYDQALSDAVTRFQERHGMTVDGKVGPETMAGLNRTIDEQVRTVVLNLERWRWLPADLGARHIRVNLAGFDLEGIVDDRPEIEMRVIVGKEGNSTPVFSDRMEYAVVNPYWNIPHSLATREILPKGPGYVTSKGYEVVAGWGDDARVVPATSSSLAAVRSGDYRLRQPPGPSNALGRIKFIFPNDDNIYLHDTPADHLFEEAERDFSHGCVRVERPFDLAEWVFSPWNRLDAVTVESMVAAGESSHEKLDEPLPVYLLYWTAFVRDGQLELRDDLYGFDESLASALRARYPEGLDVGLGIAP